MGESDEIKDSRYGILQKVRNPRVPAAWIRTREGKSGFFSSLVYGTIKGSLSAPLHAGPFSDAIREHILANKSDGPFIIHTSYLWSGVACMVRDGLAGSGMRVKVLNSVFTTMRHEFRGKLKGARKIGDWKSVVREWMYLSLMSGFLLPWERRSYRHSDALLCNYHSVRRLVEGEFGSMPHARKVSYTTEAMMQQGIEGLGACRHPKVENDSPCIVCVSRHDPRKGIDQLIRAFAILSSRGVAFQARIGSDGHLFEQHRRLVEELGLQGSVVFTGWVDDPGELYRVCDVYVLPSLEEGSGAISLLEAMMHGNCIVASDIDGIPEDVRHGEEAWLVPPADPVALADALQTLLADPDLRSRLGEAAKRRFMELFHPDRFLSELGRAYDEILEAD
jgi:hypothetical protein